MLIGMRFCFSARLPCFILPPSGVCWELSVACMVLLVCFYSALSDNARPASRTANVFVFDDGSHIGLQ